MPPLTIVGACSTVTVTIERSPRLGFGIAPTRGAKVGASSQAASEGEGDCEGDSHQGVGYPFTRWQRSDQRVRARGWRAIRGRPRYSPTPLAIRRTGHVTRVLSIRRHSRYNSYNRYNRGSRLQRSQFGDPRVRMRARARVRVRATRLLSIRKPEGWRRSRRGGPVVMSAAHRARPVGGYRSATTAVGHRATGVSSPAASHSGRWPRDCRSCRRGSPPGSCCRRASWCHPSCSHSQASWRACPRRTAVTRTNQ